MFLYLIRSSDFFILIKKQIFLVVSQNISLIWAHAYFGHTKKRCEMYVILNPDRQANKRNNTKQKCDEQTLYY